MYKKVATSLLLSSALFASTILPAYASPVSSPSKNLTNYSDQDLILPSDSEIIRTEIISENVEKTQTLTDEGIVETVTDTTKENRLIQLCGG